MFFQSYFSFILLLINNCINFNIIIIIIII